MIANPSAVTVAAFTAARYSIALLEWTRHTIGSVVPTEMVLKSPGGNQPNADWLAQISCGDNAQLRVCFRDIKSLEIVRRKK